MLSFAELRAEVETLAGVLPGFDQISGFRTTAQPGAAPRSRSGLGEEFWQFRGQTPDDTAAAIDWRRSATGDELFIREHELQSARLLSLWVDGSEGFDWKSEAAPFSKADCARIILTAIGMRYSESGDLVNVIEGVNGLSTSHHLVGPLLDDFMHLDSNMPGIPRPDTAQIILASDFYGDLSTIEDWVARESVEGRTGVLLQLIDPLEKAFPFTGRVRFRIPGLRLERIFGRTELMKEAYLDRFKARADALQSLARGVGWHFIQHCTEDPIAPTAYQLMQTLNAEGIS